MTKLEVLLLFDMAGFLSPMRFSVGFSRFPTAARCTAIWDDSESRASWNGTPTPGEAVWPIA